MNGLVEIKKSPRIDRLIKNLFEKMPEIEADRAVLLTESYKQTENLPIIERRAKAFRHIAENIPITIRDEELIVGSATKAPNFLTPVILPSRMAPTSNCNAI